MSGPDKTGVTAYSPLYFTYLLVMGMFLLMTASYNFV